MDEVEKAAAELKKKQAGEEAKAKELRDAAADAAAAVARLASLKNATPIPPGPRDNENNEVADGEKKEAEVGPTVTHDATYPAGTRELEGKAYAHKQEEVYILYWLKWREDIDWVPPFICAKDVRTITTEEKGYTRIHMGLKSSKYGMAAGESCSSIQSVERKDGIVFDGKI